MNDERPPSPSPSISDLSATLLEAFARAGRDIRGRFIPGRSGNPAGRPKGSGRLQRELRRLQAENARLKAEALARATAPSPIPPTARAWERERSIGEVAEIVRPTCGEDMLDPVLLAAHGIRRVPQRVGPPRFFQLTADGMLLGRSRRAVVKTGKAGPPPLPVIRYRPR